MSRRLIVPPALLGLVARGPASCRVAALFADVFSVVLTVVILLAQPQSLAAAPAVSEEPQKLIVTGQGYDALPAVSMAGRRIVSAAQWARPTRNEFIIEKGGLVRDLWALPGMLQGMLHQELRNPPTFVVNMPHGGQFRVHVRAVAQLGARLQWQVDGRIEKTVDLPDRDGRNDSAAHEYDQTFELPIPPGRHRLVLDNTGGDWARIDWYAVVGEIAVP